MIRFIHFAPGCQIYLIDCAECACIVCTVWTVPFCTTETVLKYNFFKMLIIFLYLYKIKKVIVIGHRNARTRILIYFFILKYIF